MTVAAGCPLCMALSVGSLIIEVNEAVRANRTGKALTHRDLRESQDKTPDGQAVWGQCERGQST